MKSISMYGNAVSILDHKVETFSKNITLRYPIFCPVSGRTLRVTFDNYCGTEPITISKVTAAKCDPMRPVPGSHNINDVWRTIETDTLVPITFNGGVASTVIYPGSSMTSDSFEIPVTSGEYLSVSFYLGEYTEMRSSVIVTGPNSKGFYAVGDHTETELLPMDYTRNTNCFYFLSDIEIEVNDSSPAHTIVCYGDSITAQSWPDYLQNIFHEAELTEAINTVDINNLSDFHDSIHTAIVRKAASGTRVLREYTNITYESYGLKATNRFLHELPVPGADTIIIQQGINDIIHPVGLDVNPFRPMEDLPTAEELIEGLRYYIREARKMGLRVIFGTLLPIYGWRTYADFREVLKNEINDWIRTTDEIDDYIDFDLAVRDPEKPEAFLPANDSGDHLHPSELGYKRMADAAYEVLKKY